ncbi:MAG: hypothetical protein HFH86_01955 [Bacilli bacterium]|nr:hypothetical protein [Bacilli bacterium]
MGFLSKIWEKIQISTKTDATIFDINRKLIDIPTILECSIKEIYTLKTEELLDKTKELLENHRKKLAQLELEAKTTDNNENKKQLEKKWKEEKKKEEIIKQIVDIFQNSDIFLTYLETYQERLNIERFIQKEKIINILDFFNLTPNFSLEDLTLAREKLENNAYNLPPNEKNKKIDEINHYFEILNDPTTRYGYLDILKNPNTIEIMQEKIKELKLKKKAQELAEEKKQKKLIDEQTTATLFSSPNEIIEQLNKQVKEKKQKKEEPPKNSIDKMEELEIEELNLDNPKENQNSPDLIIESQTKEELLNQIQIIEESIIPNLKELNSKIKENTSNPLLLIAKESILKRYSKELAQNKEYIKLNQRLKYIENPKDEIF